MARKRRRRMDAIMEKLVEAGLEAFREKGRLAVPANLFDQDQDIDRMVVQLTEASGGLVRAHRGAGTVTFYDDEQMSDGDRVFVVMVEGGEATP